MCHSNGCPQGPGCSGAQAWLTFHLLGNSCPPSRRPRRPGRTPSRRALHPCHPPGRVAGARVSALSAITAPVQPGWSATKNGACPGVRTVSLLRAPMTKVGGTASWWRVTAWYQWRAGSSKKTATLRGAVFSQRRRSGELIFSACPRHLFFQLLLICQRNASLSANVQWPRTASAAGGTSRAGGLNGGPPAPFVLALSHHPAQAPQLRQRSGISRGMRL